jgi:hypothetical protein
MNRAVAQQAAGQYGLVTHEQLTVLDLSDGQIRHLVEAGYLRRIVRGLYVVAGAPASWRQALLAAALAAGPHAAASYFAAAALWRLPGFEEGAVEVSTWYGCDHEFTLGRLHQSCLLHPEDLTVVDAIRVTRPARTLFDLASAVSPRRLERALNNALAMHLVSVEQLREVLDRLGRRGRPGTRVFRAVVEKLERRSAHPESGLETEFLRVVSDAGLPEPDLQVEIGDDQGFIGRVDAIWRPQAVIGEVDSDRFHTAPLDVAADEARDKRLRALGFHVVRIPEDDVWQRPQRVVRGLRAALGLAA